MLNLQKLDNQNHQNIYTFTVDGPVDQAGVEKFYQQLEQHATAHHAKNEQLRVLGTIQDFPKFNEFRTLAETVRMKRKPIQGISKYAVVAPNSLTGTLLPVGNILSPGIPVRHFEPSQREQAINWLASNEPVKQGTPMGVNIEQSPNAQILNFTIDGQLNEAGVNKLYDTFRQKAAHGNVRLLGTVKDFTGFDNLQTLLNGIRADFATLGHTDRCALVTEKEWLDNVIKTANYVTPGLELKAYSLADKQQAMAWLQE